MRGLMTSSIVATIRLAVITAVLVVTARSASPMEGHRHAQGQRSTREAPPEVHEGKSVAAASAQRALERARALVPLQQPYAVVLIDPDLAGDPDAVRRLDAFIVRENDGRLRPKIYVNRDSAIMQQATHGNDFYVSVLAAVIVHEFEHLNGGDEQSARAAERRFFEGLIAQGHVARSDGLRYLDLLRRQRDQGR
jgi:hypothetical protein